MRTITLILGVLSTLVGLLFLLFALAEPSGAAKDYSAIQMTQLYTMAVYYAVVSIAFFCFAGLCLLSRRSAQ